jgi:hypothetical protein
MQFLILALLSYLVVAPAPKGPPPPKPTSKGKGGPPPPCHQNSCGFNSTCVGTTCIAGCQNNGDCNSGPPNSWICATGCQAVGKIPRIYPQLTQERNTSRILGVCVHNPNCGPAQNPVCGCDGMTYSNACKAQQAGLGNSYLNGACPAPRPCTLTSQCPAGYECDPGPSQCSAIQHKCPCRNLNGPPGQYCVYLGVGCSGNPICPSSCVPRQLCDPAHPCPQDQRCVQDTSINCNGPGCQHVCVHATCNATYPCGPGFSCVSGGIRVTSARYGQNCDPNHVGADRKSIFSTACDGLQSCSYTFDYTKTGGDPYPGCAKNLIVSWTCPNGQSYTTTAPPEAGFNSVEHLSCPSQCLRLCRGIANTQCTDGETCVDAPDNCVGPACPGVCVQSKCSGPGRCPGSHCCLCGYNQDTFCSNQPCPASCTWLPCPAPPPPPPPMCGIHPACDSSHVCYNGACQPRCGGIAGISCSPGQICIDVPDNCDPTHGGADCPGVCVTSKCGIQVISARYGQNCDPNHVGADRSSTFSTACNGLLSCDYTFDYTKTGGDPYPGCGKNLIVTWSCPDGLTYSITAPPEAGFNSVEHLSCGIKVTSARYGKNCDPNHVGADRSSVFANACDGLDSCSYTFDYTKTGGDPYPGCAKNLIVNWTCPDGQAYGTSAAAEAGFNSVENLACPSGIQVTSARYGQNCDPNHIGADRTSVFATACNGLQQCTYTFDYTKTGGDPYPGCGKNLIVTWTCHDGQSHTTTIAPEAGFNSVEHLSCPNPTGCSGPQRCCVCNNNQNKYCASAGASCNAPYSPCP